MRISQLLPFLAIVVLPPSSHGINSDFFRSPDILEDKRHPLSVTGQNGDFVTVGHFRGVIRQGRKKQCNGFSCFTMPNQVLRSKGWADAYVSKYNVSRVLQWTRIAGGSGDDKGRAVNVNHDGEIMVAGYITGVNARFDTLTLSSRTALSRTLFLAKYSQAGAIQFVVEIGACAIPTCDITSMSQDETGVVLTGTYYGRTSFGTVQKCTELGECFEVERGALEVYETGTLKSSGSGMVFTNKCWLAKFDNRGQYLWHKDCNDPSFASDHLLDYREKANTFEQSVWASKAATFFTQSSKDQTGLLGRETNYEEYASLRRSSGF